MLKNELAKLYRGYIACLNQQDWEQLERFVGDEVFYNGTPVGLQQYREMLERNYREVPDLRFNIQILMSDPPYVASRLAFRCSPTGMFLGLPVNGKVVSFTENVFYEFRDGRIENVWSVIDRGAIEAQISH